mgnify:FL=1
MPLTTSLQGPARVIDLAALRGEDVFPGYVVIFSRQCDSPFVLSPRVMRWSADILLCRLDDCRQFWLNQKKKLRCSLEQLFEPILTHHFGESFLAVFANHPWQCLLYLQYQQRHLARGIFFLHSPLNQNIYRTLDWDSWFFLQQGLAEHLLAMNAKGFNEPAFRSKQAQFRRFIERIGVANPAQMKQADANAITRRFGQWMGRIWSWSLGRPADLELFPWIAHSPGEQPGVNRDLDYPVNQWAYIEVLLREDLMRLCDQFYRDDCQHINRMLWQIKLFNDDTIYVELSFRHPYSLHRDMPEFDTLIYQARYIYDDLVTKLQAREHDLDLPESMPFIGWRIEVCERIQLSPLLWDLFAAEFEQIDYGKIMSLQNKLPVAFESYQCDTSFYVEDSFKAVAIGAHNSLLLDDTQWSSASLEKPLFYYPDAQPIAPPSGLHKQFLERSSRQWWQADDAAQSLRDYFILKDGQGRASWVFRTQNGEWFKQGEYC